MVKKMVKCSCGKRSVINTSKHKFREKRCPRCLQIIDNLSPKTRVLSMFQKKKEEAKKLTRERFVNRMLAMKMPLKEIEKRLVKKFDCET